VLKDVRLAFAGGRESGPSRCIGGRGPGPVDHGNRAWLRRARLDRPRPIAARRRDLCRALGHFQLKVGLVLPPIPKGARTQGKNRSWLVNRALKMNMEVRHPRHVAQVSPVAIALGHRRVMWGRNRRSGIDRYHPAAFERGINLSTQPRSMDSVAPKRSLAGAIAETSYVRTCLLPPRPDFNGGRKSISRCQSRPHMREVEDSWRSFDRSH